ncbi:rod shape-determining protein MreD [Pontixanthobacter aquaemixtae]|uniref:Rod shape-determining protein MreD n=1 Tax=Pontixanthobacter aquaemixtae TaxID=1958940 RepID=A0A844ZXG2_9SPHN|nr:rod shape-determining protein MreD [Pontixanthobacter aquaemixtae]MXO90189.1 rod shape-determining protein MreD [Pontixanthobacter aquaemixtae]
MDQVNPKARSDEYGSRINRAHSPVLFYAVPYLTILLGSILPTLPIASALPLIPPMGFIILLAWRMIRPGLFPVWVGFPLGMFDDLFSGQPFGSAIMLWSISMIVFDILEARFPWRSFAQDWLTLGLGIAAYLLIGAVLSGAPLTLPGLIALAPQILLSFMIYPMVVRVIARLDRLRLKRIRVIG